jgi:hypothetical protein
MTPDELLLRTDGVLSRHRIGYMLVGGMAVSSWVKPRFTDDVDIVVRAGRRDAPRLKRALIDCGARVTALEMRLLYEKRFVRLPIEGTRLDVHVVSSAHDREASGQVGIMETHGQRIPVCSAEDLVLYKLQAWRLHDQDDIQRILREVKDLNKAYIERWLGRIAEDSGTPVRERWAEARGWKE